MSHTVGGYESYLEYDDEWKIYHKIHCYHPFARRQCKISSTKRQVEIDLSYFEEEIEINKYYYYSDELQTLFR